MNVVVCSVFVVNSLSTIQATVEPWCKSTKLLYLCLLKSMPEIDGLSQHHP